MRKCFLYFFIFITSLLLAGCVNDTDFDKIKTFDFILDKSIELNEETLVVFDVDEVLITPINPFFHAKSISTQFWMIYYYLFSTGDVFFKDVVKHYENALFTTKYALVDPMLPSLIKKLQSKNIKVIALTSCPTGKHKQIGTIENWRIAHLLSFDISFKNAFPEYNNLLFNELSQSNPPLFKDGILFANRKTKKGPLLKAFLEKVGWKPQKIVFIDDEEKNLRSVINTMKTLNMECICLQCIAANKFEKCISREIIKQKITDLISKEKWISQ